MKRITGLLLFFGLLVLIHISCDEEYLQGDRWYTVSGTVYDSITGLAIDSVKISVSHIASANNTLSDSLGRYSMNGLADMVYIAQKEGYINDTIEIYVEKDTAGLDFYLSKQS